MFFFILTKHIPSPDEVEVQICPGPTFGNIFLQLFNLIIFNSIT